METNMQTEKKGSVFSIIAGAAFALLALRQLVYLFKGFSVVSLLYLLVEVFMAVVLFAKKRDVLLLVATSLLSLLKLYTLIRMMRYGSFLIFLPHFFDLLAVLALLAYAVVLTTDLLVQYRDKVKQLWFVPLILAAVYFILFLFRGSFLVGLLSAAGYVLASLWIVYPNGIPQETSMNGQTEPGKTVNGTQAAGNGYVDMLTCVLLLLFTFGIYYLIWIYRTTRYLNRVEGEPQRNPTTKLLLCWFIPFYAIYWTYQSAHRVDKLAQSVGVNSDLTMLCTILSIFIGIIPPMLMQEKINAVIGVENGSVNVNTAAAPQAAAANAAAANASAATQAPKSELDTVAELKAYKELLDSGVITQEEFDEKKKQLLG